MPRIVTCRSNKQEEHIVKKKKYTIKIEKSAQFFRMSKINQKQIQRIIKKKKIKEEKKIRIDHQRHL